MKKNRLKSLSLGKETIIALVGKNQIQVIKGAVKRGPTSFSDSTCDPTSKE